MIQSYLWFLFSVAFTLTVISLVLWYRAKRREMRLMEEIAQLEKELAGIESKEPKTFANKWSH